MLLDVALDVVQLIVVPLDVEELEGSELVIAELDVATTVELDAMMFVGMLLEVVLDVAESGVVMLNAEELIAVMLDVEEFEISELEVAELIAALVGNVLGVIVVAAVRLEDAELTTELPSSELDVIGLAEDELVMMSDIDSAENDVLVETGLRYAELVELEVGVSGLGDVALDWLKLEEMGNVVEEAESDEGDIELDIPGS